MLTPGDLPGHLAERRRAPGPDGRPLSVAVIGAGAAGAMAARVLDDQGHEVRVYEKSRGPGGRMATRRAGELQFDHGAQYFTLRDARLGRLREAWADTGIIAPWPAAGTGSETRWVALPGMNALARHLLDGITVRYEFTIESVHRHVGRWRLDGRDASDVQAMVGDFDALVVAVPAPQAVRLLSGVTPLAEQLGAAEYSPCWAVMAGGIDAVDQPALLNAAQSIRAQADRNGPLAWAAHDGGKPGRGGGSWVLQAGERWSRAELERKPAEVATMLWAAFAARAGIDVAPPRHLEAHRWRFARVLRPLGRECLWDGEQQLAACGDYCLGARVEAALLSGAAAAGRLMTWASGAR
jgi:renalase